MKKLIAALCLFSLILCGCASSEEAPETAGAESTPAESTPESTAAPVLESYPVPTPKTSSDSERNPNLGSGGISSGLRPVNGPEGESVPFAAQYIRTDGYHEGIDYPLVAVISSRAQLENYAREKENLYHMAPFLGACENYDDAFFAENQLILVLLQESSGSVRHEVTSLRHEDASDTWGVSIRSIVPEIGTDDMAQWHIVVEVHGGGISADDNIIVY